MSEQPTVCAVMLVNGRPEMTARAVASFRGQTYRNKWLMIWDTTEQQTRFYHGIPIIQHWPIGRHSNARTIGALRNEAINMCGKCDIIATFDSDDWSHPNRLAEQVALLQASGKECVGYREALFWCTRLQRQHQPFENDPNDGEAWLYTSPLDKDAVGASLCYWRSTWERRPFRDLMQGEDTQFLMGVKNLGIEGFGGATPGNEPRLICAIHAGSTTKSTPDRNHPQWRRVPEWDQYCRERMAL